MTMAMKLSVSPAWTARGELFDDNAIIPRCPASKSVSNTCTPPSLGRCDAAADALPELALSTCLSPGITIVSRCAT